MDDLSGSLAYLLFGRKPVLCPECGVSVHILITEQESDLDKVRDASKSSFEC